MTPQEARERARRFASAAITLADTQPDVSSYNAGYAVELALKARACALNGWKRLPGDRREATEWAREAGLPNNRVLWGHDLNNLLKVSDSLRMETDSYHDVDWDTAADWDSTHRYQPVGSVTPERARERAGESEKVVCELETYEIIRVLMKIERELTEEHGLFFLFAYFISPHYNRWGLYFVYGGQTEYSYMAMLRDVECRLKRELDEDLRARINHVRPMSANREEVLALIHYAEKERGGVQGEALDVRTGFESGYDGVEMPTGVIITAGDWTSEQIASSMGIHRSPNRFVFQVGNKSTLMVHPELLWGHVNGRSATCEDDPSQVRFLNWSTLKQGSIVPPGARFRRRGRRA